MLLPSEVHQLNVRTVTILGEPGPTRPALTLEPASPTPTILGTYTIPPDSEPTAAGTKNAATSSSKSNTPTIVGATIGGVVALVLVAFLVWCLRRRRGRKPYSGSPGSTPMLGDHGEKSRMVETPETGSLKGGGGVFAPFPFSGYKQAPMEEPLPFEGQRPRDSMEIQDAGLLYGTVANPNDEKKDLYPPPHDEHPAYHPLPGQNLPAYVPKQPAYNTLPSQRSLAPPSDNQIPEQSPKIPGLVFTPINIVLDNPLETIPITPKAELAASPILSKPPPSPIPSSKFSTARTPPPPPSPRRASPRNASPPMAPAPLAKVATSRSPPHEKRPLTNFSMKHISSPRPGFPSPTAGGKIELPACLPPVSIPVASDVPVKAPLNPTPAFHHIYLPEPLSGVTRSSVSTAYSTIPIGLGDSQLDIQKSHDDLPKLSNLGREYEYQPSPQQGKQQQTGHERNLSQQHSREFGSPPLPGKTKRRPQPASREARASPPSPPPPQERMVTPPPLPSVKQPAAADIHLQSPFRDPVPGEKAGRSKSNPKGRSSPTRPPLRKERSDVSAMSDSYDRLREKASDQSFATVSEESDIAPIPIKTSKHKKKWSASEKDGTSLLVYKGASPLAKDEVSPLFSPARRIADDGDVSIQPLVLQNREGWSAVPLTPMTPSNKTRAHRVRADGMF